MEKLNQLIKERASRLTASGIHRVRYAPYKMESALQEIIEIGKELNPKFRLTPDVRDLYVILTQYFHADENCPLSLSKGIVLQGPTGTGKTLAMKVMRHYQEIDEIKIIFNNKLCQMYYEIYNVHDIVNGFLQKAFDGIQNYINRNVICLDDIGTEIQEVKYFGNKLEVISHILSERHRMGKLTFATTNLPKEKLAEFYGDRVFSRMCEMFEFITVKGNDFRRI